MLSGVGDAINTTTGAIAGAVGLGKKTWTPHPLDLEIQQRFLALEQSGMIQAEYVWIVPD